MMFKGCFTLDIVGVMVFQKWNWNGNFTLMRVKKMCKGLILGLTTETPVVGKDGDDNVCGPIAIVA